MLSPRGPGAVIDGLTAVVASYPGRRLRAAALAWCGQTSTGFAEDAIGLAAAAIIRSHKR